MPQVVAITVDDYNVKNKNLHKNPNTKFLENTRLPKVNKGAFIHPYAIVIGDVTIDENVNIAPNAVIRADEGTPIFIGRNSNIQDGVILHGLKDLYKTHNNKNYSVYIGENTSVAHQAQVHGPAKIGDNVFVGMQAFVYKSEIGNNVVIEPTARVIDVKIADNKYVPAGEIVKTQEKADKLPDITKEYVNKNLNEEVVEVNKELAKGYLNQKNQKPSFNGRIKVCLPNSSGTSLKVILDHEFGKIKTSNAAYSLNPGFDNSTHFVDIFVKNGTVERMLARTVDVMLTIRCEKALKDSKWLKK